MPFVAVRSLEEWTARFGDGVRAAISVGAFDGLHLGHQRILREVLDRARANSCRAVAITFDPHPLRVLRPAQAPPMIQTLSQRLAGFERMGLDAALVLRFDRALSLLSPEEFVKQILIERIHVADVLAGPNFIFGHRGAGDVRLLAQLGKTLGFAVEIVPPAEIGGHVVSSTLIRNAVAGGDVAEAARMLGRPFALTGEIRSGAGRGRTILVPTLNLTPEQELLPKLGVYATESTVALEKYFSVTNVGTRPTFDGQPDSMNGSVSVESHLLGFEKQVTSGPMEVRFETRLRDEQKFPGPEALRMQIARDIIAARDFFSRRGSAERSNRS